LKSASKIGSNTNTRAACTNRSRAEGIPSLLNFPGCPDLGINRSRAGNGVKARAFTCSRVSLRKAATSAGSEMNAGITRSTPGVRAPLFPATRSHATARKSG
jgi:hypothetical protein